ncbi:hypothetical protein HPB49_007303 [Dermacentor silvarum]|uniref:Uncharacterized protein n=1 Tax=Dermacentor silvarum TaxID=543639 RepID=A0ACB8CQC3_DERSI|nr:hypothetical protein HPB49_007303 [Dermacentor silvarum]
MTLSRVIERVSRLIATHMFPIVVKFPSIDNEFRATMVEFYHIAKFPEVTGGIDCTHTRIKSLGGPNGEVYRNRKGYFFINVQVSSSSHPHPEYCGEGFRCVEASLPMFRHGASTLGGAFCSHYDSLCCPA